MKHQPPNNNKNKDLWDSLSRMNESFCKAMANIIIILFSITYDIRNYDMSLVGSDYVNVSS